MFKRTLAFLLFASLAFSTVTLNYPKKLSLEFDHADFERHINYVSNAFLGSVEPGQTIRLVFDRQTSGGTLWDHVEILGLPNWQVNTTFDSNRDTTTLTAFITVPKEAQEENYSFNLNAVGERGVRTTEQSTLSFQVRKDLYFFSLASEYAVTIGSPEKFSFPIKSDSIGDEKIYFSASGLPSDWVMPEMFQATPLAETTVWLETTPQQEGLYHVTLTAHRTSNDATANATTSLRAYPGFKAKLKATSEGFSLTHIILQPFYSIISFFSGLFG